MTILLGLSEIPRTHIASDVKASRQSWTPVIVASARKHQVSDDDMLHACRNPIRVFDLGNPTMLIGPDTAARLLEVGVCEAEGTSVHRSCHARTTQISGGLIPRSIQDILDHADELADRFENYEPEPDDERPVEEYLLERAALARARNERQIVDALLLWGRSTVGSGRRRTHRQAEMYDPGVPEDVVTAAELEGMSPAERRALFEASIVTNLDDAPRGLVERARTRVEQRIAESKSQPG